MDYQQAVQADEGKEVSYPAGEYPGECLSWVKDYITKRWGFEAPASGDGAAKGYFLNFPAPLGNHFEKVANNHGDPSQVPVQGDIIIWDGDVPGSEGAGHCAVVDNATPGAATFTSYDQNWGGNKTVHEVTHNWKGEGTILGWLHPLENGGTAPGSSHPETVAPGTWYAHSQPSLAAVHIGIVKGGQTFQTTVVAGNWREISFNGSTAFVSQSAWSN